ncbi:DUF2521 family protein [Pullulanibacillus sp. KACC 23026]|uniref:DUF2521 family protein n=1 Tax=Pullulanibacillus sp. KACC 23026 TaxID=3028315 RepID=UPI0023B0D99C|nr:DUF2521 family protein [Pullulanibacillus sp. KACC 23026]WEG12627.1 DUF2521 family protein [Pullulanibacillus sp. KACC 23026]
MGTVTHFHEKYRHKQIDFERKTLRDLSIQKIESNVEMYFENFLKPMGEYQQTICDMCMDYGIEAYLFGASFGRMGYYGETETSVYLRSEKRLKELTEDLFDFWTFWYGAEDLVYESLYFSCEAFLYSWWKEGFQTTIKRLRMRLH